jgi:peptidoglycan hydrolase-like protein with peptidoglycan-binding domain
MGSISAAQAGGMYYFSNTNELLQKSNCYNTEAKNLQQDLTTLGYNTYGVDGYFGQNTYNAVKAFQAANGLSSDGAAGNQTLSKIDYLINQAKSQTVQKTTSNTQSDTVSISGNLSIGSRGTAVSDLQSSLTKLGYNTYGIDGDFGQNTKNAVVSFQRAHGLTQDGIVGNQTKSAIAAAISNNSTSSMISSSTTSSNLQMGSRGTAVTQLQSNLTSLGYNTYGIDGDFGQNTKNAVVAFQKAHGLTQDGIVGTQTQSAIASAISSKSTSSTISSSSTSSNLQMGSKGTAVTQLQNYLTSLGYNTYGIDGNFGQNTKNAVVAFQKAHGLQQDGVVGSQTESAIATALSNNSSPTNSNSNILKIGMSGTDVQKLQSILTAIGYNTGGIDGQFGQNTKNAVLAFQQNHGLQQDGVVGNQTITILLGSVRTTSGENLFEGLFNPKDLNNMSLKDILNKIPDNWDVKGPYNGHITIRDDNEAVKIRIDPPDKVTNYDHVHLKDENGNPLNDDLQITGPKDPSSHIQYKGPIDDEVVDPEIPPFDFFDIF